VCAAADSAWLHLATEAAVEQHGPGGGGRCPHSGPCHGESLGPRARLNQKAQDRTQDRPCSTEAFGEPQSGIQRVSDRDGGTKLRQARYASHLHPS
jgi:hypothetical protein